MNRPMEHAFEPEEIMAYLDGELEPRRALEVATHMDHCAECARVAEGIRGTSAHMREWTVEAPSAGLDQAVLAALKGARPAAQKRNLAARLKSWWRANGWKGLVKSPYPYAFASAGLAMLLVASVVLRENVDLSHQVAEMRAAVLPASRQTNGLEPAPPAQPQPAPPLARGTSTALSYQASDQLETSESGGGEGAGNAPSEPAITAPMIAQTASLDIVATNYDQASGAIEALAKARGGYVQKLDASSQTGSARSVTATIRVPAAQLGAFLNDLKKLGHVEQASQENEEVTDQYVDVEARLKSAKTTEQRLIELQATRTGRLSDVLDVERELERVRGEIEQMQGESAVLVHRVQYASVDVTIHEEYREGLQTGAPSKGTLIWNAVVDGFHNLEGGVISLLVFLLAFGPSILFWVALFAVPAWLIWRKRRRATKAAA